MGLFDAINNAGSGLTAERMAMDVTSDNLANAQTPGYRRKVTSFQEVLDNAQNRGAVQVSGISEDSTPNKMVYDPTNPSANAKGYVSMPNINSVTEMTDLIQESRGYEANVTAMATAKQMFTKTLDLLR
jgi:flagellar basal-body rod protein FlgC